jgi:phosphopantothenoylcysteine decarboxylase/phosphopantothenate--cysteine ligase
MKKEKHSPKIVLGVSAGIAAYKSCEVARLLIKAGCEVQVTMTPAAEKFVTAMTFQAITGRPVATDLFDLTQESQIGHIRLADTADLILIAPATANVIARIAHGLADDIVTTVVLATRAPVMLAPSMNVNMWDNPITQANIAALKGHGYRFIDPEAGFLACGWEGMGRLAEPQTIVEVALKSLPRRPKK